MGAEAAIVFALAEQAREAERSRVIESPLPGGSGAPVDATYVVLSLNATLTDERVATSVANGITVVDGGAGGAVTWTLPQALNTGASPTFVGLTLSGLTASRVVITAAGGTLTTDTQLTYDSATDILTASKIVATTSITDNGLTSGRVTFAGASGILSDAATLLWDGSFLTVASIKDSALTSGRVTFAGASGLLTDGANFTYDGTTLTVAVSNAATTPTVELTQASTGDSSMRFALGATSSWAIGVDNSVANDPFVFSFLGSGSAVLASNPVLSLLGAGAGNAVTAYQAPTTTAGGTRISLFGIIDASAASNSSTTFIGVRSTATTVTNVNYTGDIIGGEYIANHGSTGTASELIGARLTIRLQSTAGNVTSASGVNVVTDHQSASTLATMRGVYVPAPGVSGGGAITNFIGLQVDTPTAAGTNLAIRTNGGGIIFNESGTDSDFRVEGDTATNLLFLDASIDALQIGTTVPGVIADFRAATIVFNETGAAIDFRVEGDSLQYLFFVNGSDSALENIAAFTSAEPDWKAMDNGFFIGNVSTAPTGNPVAGGFMYSNAGAGTWRGSGGTVTAFGPAGPHCGNCGWDAWTVAMINPEWQAYCFICGHCGAKYERGPQSVFELLATGQKKQMITERSTFKRVAEIMGA